jgi:hypothetical protein
MTVPIITRECQLRFNWVKLPRDVLAHGKADRLPL